MQNNVEDLAEKSEDPLCNFEKFKTHATVNSLLGKARNPFDKKFYDEKPNNVSVKMNLLGPLNIDYTNTG